MPISSKGKVYTVKGKKLRLFPISTLACELTKALDSPRTTQTIRKWESSGVIPPSIFRVGGKRLYTMEQIKCICRIAKEEGIKQGYSLSLSKFSSRVFKELKDINSKIFDKERER